MIKSSEALVPNERNVEIKILPTNSTSSNALPGRVECERNSRRASDNILVVRLLLIVADKHICNSEQAFWDVHLLLVSVDGDGLGHRVAAVLEDGVQLFRSGVLGDIEGELAMAIGGGASWQGKCWVGFNGQSLIAGRARLDEWRSERVHCIQTKGGLGNEKSQ